MSKGIVVTSIGLAVTLGLGACASRVPVNLPPYDAATYQPFAAAGSATVTGSSFLVTKGGDVKKGAARIVVLIPETPFLLSRMKEDDTYYPTFDWLGFSGESKETITKAWAFTRTTTADADGKFSFSKVPAGKYIVETRLFWQYMSCGFLGCRLTDTGAVLRKRVDVLEGATVDAQLTSPVPL